MEIVTKVMEKSWKSHGNLLVKMCTNPEYIYIHWMIKCCISLISCYVLLEAIVAMSLEIDNNTLYGSK